MRTKISFDRNENKYIKSLFGKSSFGGLRTPVDHAIFYFFLVSSKDYTSLVSLIKVMTFRENQF
jgi:hypothetical protein